MAAFAVTGRDHRQLRTEREALQAKDGPASEDADDGGQHGENDGLHPRHRNKSMQSTGTRYLVGAAGGQGDAEADWLQAEAQMIRFVLADCNPHAQKGVR